MLPVLLVVVSSFVKVLVVLGILRNALGFRGCRRPSCWSGWGWSSPASIMAPVARAMVEEAERALAAEAPAPGPEEPPGAVTGPELPADATSVPLGDLSWEQLSTVGAAAAEPPARFFSLAMRIRPTRNLFVELSRRGGAAEPLAEDDLLVLTPRSSSPS